MNRIYYNIKAYNTNGNCSGLNIPPKCTLKVSTIIHHYVTYLAKQGLKKFSHNHYRHSFLRFKNYRVVSIALIISLIQQKNGGYIVCKSRRKTIICDTNSNISYSIYKYSDLIKAVANGNLAAKINISTKFLKGNKAYEEIYDPAIENLEIKKWININNKNFESFLQSLRNNGPITFYLSKDTIAEISYTDKCNSEEQNDEDVYIHDFMKVAIKNISVN